MSRRLRITAVNAAYDASAAGLDTLIDRYETLTGWCDAVSAAGAEVHVVQRFTHGGAVTRGAVPFIAVDDGEPAVLAPHVAPPAVIDAVVSTAPDVIHVNGLGFPTLVRALRRGGGDDVRIVVQDHAGVTRPLGPGARAWLDRRRWRAGLAAADAVSFTAAGQAAPWTAAGVLSPQRVLAIPESSTHVVATPREDARRRTRLDGTPLVLWIGRLTAAKDPLTVLAAFAETAAARPDAHLAMVFQGGPLAATVEEAVARTPGLGRRVTLVGAVPHRAIGDYLGAADFYVSGSHAEGSGYALIEAMACGVVPVVTEIPPFAAIAGECGRRWPPGDRAACAAALQQAFANEIAAVRSAVTARFARELAWPVVGARTVAAYTQLVAGGSA